MAGHKTSAIDTAELLVHEARRFQSPTAESFGLTALSLTLEPGTATAAATAKQALDLGRSTGTTVVEVFASRLYLTQLLGHDVDAARDELLVSLDREALSLHVTYERMILGCAAAYFAVVGNHQLAAEIGRAVGALHLQPAAGRLPAVDSLHRALVNDGYVLPDPAIDPRHMMAMVRRELTQDASWPGA